MGNGAMAKGPQATAPILESTISDIVDNSQIDIIAFFCKILVGKENTRDTRCRKFR